MSSSYYKYCIVPQCKSTTISTPTKLFIYIPNDKQIRKKWLNLAGRAAGCLSTRSRMYLCEDHFDLPKDMLNYREYCIMGKVLQIRMRPGCMPSKFECQENWSPECSDIFKKQGMVITECLNQREESCMSSLFKDTSRTSSESLDGEVHTTDEFQIKDELVCNESFEAEVAAIIDGLNLRPLVYTTRLDDMIVLNSDTSTLNPGEVTAEILKESKPTLQMWTNSNNSRSNKRTFQSVKARLNKIYHPDNLVKVPGNINLETSLDIKDEFPPIVTDESSIKCEVLEDPIGVQGSINVETNPIRCEVLDEPTSTCKYSELLKLCRPFSIVLEKLIGYNVIKSVKRQTNKIPKPVTTKTKKVKTVNKTNVNNATLSDDEPLITLNPSHRRPENNDAGVGYGVKSNTGQVKVRKSTKQPAVTSNPQSALFFKSFSNRILTNGLMEVIDQYSKELNIYCTDHKGGLLDYYKDTVDNAFKYKNMLAGVATNHLTIKGCCWVQRDESLQCMYPKALLYTNLRFMRKPHPCPPGTCICCCRKKEIFDTPDIPFSDDASSENPPPYLKEDIEIQALENEIQSSIINMKKAPRVNTTDILRNLLQNPSNKEGAQDSISLIDKALMYKKPTSKKPNDNRRLLTLKQITSEAGVIVLRNYATDEREVYEFNSDGGLKSFLKLTCFSNTDPPDVRKLMLKSKSSNNVCCWFEREKLITKLIDSKTLHSSSANFIRTRHTCKSNECNCCCKPNDVKDVTLTDITFPPRPPYWGELISKMKALVKPSISSDKSTEIISTSRKSIPSLSMDPTIPKMAKVDVVGTLLLKEQYPNTSFTSSNSKTTKDDDCQLVGITAAPTVVDPLNPVPTEPIAILGDVPETELSAEVNTLITSILERFKDVRLTINSDGKVAAALNTPVNTLSTVELKVLANILSYAQTQVNSLGLNSGMSLSNIINLKANDPGFVTSIDPASISQAFGATVNKTNNNNTQAPLVNNSLVNIAPAAIVSKPNAFPELPSPPTKNDINHYSTNTSRVKNEAFIDSFTSFLSTMDAQVSNDTNVPVIQNVFSLKDQENTKETDNGTSSTTVWCRKPAKQKSSALRAGNNTQILNALGNKRASVNTVATPPLAKRIRILPASKLASVGKPNQTVNTIYQPKPTSQTRTLEVTGLKPGGPQLGNKNFRVVKAINLHQLGTTPTIVRQHNFNNFAPPLVSTPLILVTPLNVKHVDANAANNDKLPLVETPISMATAATATEDQDEETETTIKIEQVYNEDDDCILGV